jgi:hypothetical protein
MLQNWHEFYGLLGTAAAALVALLFVAASIGAGFLSTDRNSPTRIFTTPVVFHYTFVLFISLIALVPIETDTSLGILIGISAAGALIYSIFILIHVLRRGLPDIEDHIGYGACPPVGYAVTLAAALFIWHHSAIGPPLLAGALMLLLLVNLRNAWDLTLFFAQRRAGDTPPPPNPTP